MLHSNLSVNSLGHLELGKVDVCTLAEKYGTPLMIVDENRVRENCKKYIQTIKNCLPEGSTALYAGKALCYAGIYKVMAEEGMSADIVSAGELYTAMRAGFPTEKMYYHGNSKPDCEIEYAIDHGIGHFVVDSAEELCKINEYAGSKGVKQKIFLRITPDIDTHTHKKISTGTIDCKFGTPIVTGQAEALVRSALAMDHVILDGLHCHVGSSIFEIAPYVQSAEIMADFIAELHEKICYTPKYLNLGGGFGVRYTEKDPEPQIENWILTLAENLKKLFQARSLPMPSILFEPGRSVVGDAGITVYSVTGVKEIPGHTNYLAIDGGMTDNPRYTLYSAKYTFLLANKANEPADYTCTVAGRCCESGDLLGERVKVQKPKKGDLLAVLTTGAYNYSMASNYNRVPRPAVVTVKDGTDKVVVRRETYEDLLSLDVL